MKKNLLLIFLILLCSIYRVSGFSATTNNLFSIEQLVNTTKVSLKANSESLDNILMEINKQTGISFGYQEKDIDKSSKFSVNIKDGTVAEALNIIFKDSDYGYKLNNNRIIIFKSNKPQLDEKKEEVVLKGKVLDSTTKEPIIGATILVLDDSGKGAVTDNEGKFALRAYLGDKIEVSFVGMFPVTVMLNRKITNEWVVFMTPDVRKIDDAIITGVFNKPRESFTGAVETITSEEIKAHRGTNLLQTLRNIDPSLSVQYSNEYGSNPNVMPDFTIRGSSSLPMNMDDLNNNVQSSLNSPIIIIDGFEASIDKLVDMSDENIKSINILKDASATSLYGSRGANGVIVIVTNEPEAGKLRVKLNIGTTLEMPDLTSYDLLNASEKLQLETALGIYNADGGYTNDIYQALYSEIANDVARGVDTDWLSIPLRVGVGQIYDLTLEGGSQEFRWSVFGSYGLTNGVMKNSSRENFNGTITLAYNYKNLLFKNQTSVGVNTAIESNYGDFSDYVNMNPYWATHDDNGDLIESYSRLSNGDVDNPLYIASLNTINSTNYIELTNNFILDWNINENLKLSGKLGITKRTSESDEYIPREHPDFSSSSITIPLTEQGQYTYGIGNSLSVQASINASYSRNFKGGHLIYAGIDASLQESSSESATFVTQGFPNSNLTFVSNALIYADEKPSGYEDTSRSIGLTASANYTYNNRYFADFSYRVDGSSKFGTNKKFAPFYNIGIGWNIHNEDFFKQNTFVNELRLRASTGEVGSQSFSSYQALTTYEYNTERAYGEILGATVIAYGNENLQWQKEKQINVGLDFGLLNNLISGNFNYYNNNTSGLLSQRSAVTATGFSSYIDNIGSTRSSGFEAAVSGYLIRDTKKGLLWSVTGRIAYNKDVITELSQAIKDEVELFMSGTSSSTLATTQLLYEGYSINSVYAVRSLGIDPSTGSEIYLDKDGNKVDEWSMQDRVYMGVTTPPYTGNISSMLSYKNFSLNLSFAYHFGGVQVNSTLINKVEVNLSDLHRYNVDRRVLEDRWMEIGDIKPFQSFENTSYSSYISSRYIYDDKMFSLQNASVSYDWRSSWVKDVAKLQSVTFSANMTDLFYVSTLKRERGTSYPFARNLQFRIGILF